MRLTSTPTKFLLLLSIVIAFAFGGEESPFYLSLSSNRIYPPGDTGISVRMEATPKGATRIHFRAYRVEDPVNFFLQQKDPHSPLLTVAKPNTFDMLREGLEKASRDAHLAARAVISDNARRTIRDVADLNGVKNNPDSSRTARPAVRRTGALFPPLPGYPIETEWDYDCEAAKDSNDRWVYVDPHVPVSKKGVYLIEASAHGKRSITTLVISDLGMIIKQAGGSAMVFVVNRLTGEKVSSFPLTFARDGARVAEGKTSGDGVAQVDIPPIPPESDKTNNEDEEEDSWRWERRQHQLLVLGESDGAFVISDPWGGEESEENRSVYLHTDRPVYRPGQTVYYRGIARTVTKEGGYQTSSGDSVFIAVNDARGNTFAKDTLRLSDMGTFNGKVVLADEPPLGSYSIKVIIGTDHSDFDFSVEEYKKPEYKVVVTTDRQKYIRGDVVNATVHADYFFGSPVANAQVEYFVYRSRYWRPWWEGSDWAYLYGGGDDDFSTYRMEMVNSGTGTLNPDGTFAISYTTDPKADEDYVYRVEANVVDNSRRSISGSKSVQVTRGAFYISLRTDKYVYRPNEEARVSVKATTFDGDKPVATRFTARAVRQWWVRDSNATSSGFGASYKYIEHRDTIWTGTGATDGNGHGTIIYKPAKGGYFEMEVSATDDRGTVINESSYLYVADDSYANWYHEGSGDVQIIPDKESYQPGETMSALVIMPAAGMDALITAEGNTIYSHQVERLSSTSAVIHMEIEDRFAPTFFLNASAIVNDEMYSESKRVTVIPRGKLLHLEVKTDKGIYKPRDKGTVMIRALDEQNEPVKDVDIAVGMADEAVYSIEPDATPNIQHFFYGYRWNRVQTTASLEFNFYDTRIREKGKFGDAMGVNGFFSMRSGRPVASRESIAFGDVKGTMFVEPVVRKDFKDLMFWAPSVRTDENGWAKLSVDFPDNLTTWRITAHGITRETAVGETVARVIARKDLLVRMETPRFLTQGDELLIATTIHNYLPSGKLTKVEFSGENVILDAKERTVEIPANGEQRIDWKIRTPKTGTARLTVKALTNQESDAMELTVPILPRGLRVATGSSADVEEQTATRTLNFTLPENSDPTSGAIHVTLSPSLASSIFNALDELIGYPYGCVEQTMSRFLPTVLVDNTLKQLDIPFDPKKRAQIPRMVGSGLMRLYGMQHKDGGWGWWVDDHTDPFMTAYVMYGMTVAKAAGYQVLEERYKNGLSALRARIEGGLDNDKRPIDLTTKAYMLYVMSMINRNAPQDYLLQRIATLGRVDTLNNYGRALVALAAEYQNNRALAMTLVAQLEQSATTNGVSASWKGRTWHYDWQNDEVETSAMVVKAILDLRGETDLAKRGIRWILSQKNGDAWDNTRQTAMVVYSLVDYLKASKELDPNYTVTVRVNGQQLFTKRMTRADVFKPEEKIRLERASLRPGVNTVTIDKSGSGRLYTTAEMTYYATGAAIKPNAAGFRVSREYFTLVKERRDDAYVYSKRPFNGTVKTGEEIFVRVHITPDARYTYFMLEDPLPAGCEVVTKTDGYTIAGEPEYDEKANANRSYLEAWYWWYSYREVRDEKIAFFADVLLPKQYDFSYILRAQIPGTYAVMPSVASLMYYPEVRGNGSMTALTITP